MEYKLLSKYPRLLLHSVKLRSQLTQLSIGATHMLHYKVRQWFLVRHPATKFTALRVLRVLVANTLHSNPLSSINLELEKLPRTHL